jgi:hypothetical protein
MTITVMAFAYAYNAFLKHGSAENEIPFNSYRMNLLNA